MNGPEHYREAEHRLLMAWEDDRDPENVRHLLAEAQVHATLALAAATAGQMAVNAFRDDINSTDVEQWADVMAQAGGGSDA
ncbi:hypothetical protein [Streptomyces sp. NPDC088258]|uniref:hypothetical protein n=1 Tax=Streptomyces sp. NPDC088258 TaxID=3365849 RepID=UPI0038183DCC